MRRLCACSRSRIIGGAPLSVTFGEEVGEQMNQTRLLANFLFGKRTTPLRWLALVTNLVTVPFLLLSVEYNAGLQGTLPYIALVALSVAYVVRPMVAIWVPIFGWFAYYALDIALHPQHLTKGDWIFFTFLGLAPAILMLLAWPLKLGPDKEPVS